MTYHQAMIKIFTKIKENLLSEGKIGRYLKYAIGEIVLIVFGILIALSIDNWNQSINREMAEKEFIEGVKKDLELDKEYIQIILNHMDPKIDAYSILNKELTMLKNKDKNSVDSLFRKYFLSQRTFYPISGSFQAAIAGNEINGFKNKKLTRGIIKLYDSTYDRLVDNGKITDERWEYLIRKHSHVRRTGNYRNLNETQISELMDDMYYHFAQMIFYKDQLKNAILEIDSILNWP